jgi:RecA-family ATPase
MVKPADWKPQLIREFLAAADECQRWIIPGFIAHEGLTLISGPRKLGMKTWLADMLSIVTTTGTQVGNLRCLDPGPVLYFEEEGTPKGTKLRWEGFEFTYGFDFMKNEQLFYTFRPRLLLDDRDWAAAIIRAVKILKPKMCVFDALTYMHRADENKTHEMRMVVETLQEIRAAGTACLFLAHTNAEGSRDLELDIDLGVRGSKVILDAYDVHIGLRRVRFDDPKIHCQIRQREGSEKVMSLTWDLVAYWNYELEAEEVWYVYPNFHSEEEAEDADLQDKILKQLDTGRGYTLPTIATKTHLRRDHLAYLLDQLLLQGRVEFLGNCYRRIK